MKKEKNYVGFHIPKIWKIAKYRRRLAQYIIFFYADFSCLSSAYLKAKLVDY